MKHPLSNCWNESFVPKDEVDRLDVTIRALRGQIMRHRPTCIRAVSLRIAREFLGYIHRHNPAITGWKFGCAMWDEVGMVGVVAVGRPVSRKLDNGRTLEITRCCLMDNAKPNSATQLLGRACRAARALGVEKMITYTLEEEPGTSLLAAGFKPVAKSPGGSWSGPTRVRENERFDTGPKVRWEKSL